MQNSYIKNTNNLIALKEFKASTMIIQNLGYEMNPKEQHHLSGNVIDWKTALRPSVLQKCVIIITMNKGHLYVDHSSPEAVKHSGLCGSSCLAVFHCDLEINKNEDGGTDHSVWTHPLHLAGC